MKCRLPETTLATVGVLVAPLSCGACALTTKAEIVDVRYFSPERAAAPSHGAVSWGPPNAASHSPPIELRLGRIFSGRNLRERIAYRDTGYELGHYDDYRWTERPEVYARRALGASLFEVHGFSRTVNGAAPTLDVEVLAFDELRLAPGRAARVTLKVVLHDDAGVLFEDTLTSDRQVAEGRPEIEGVVAAMAHALDAAVEAVALRVHKALSERLAASPVEVTTTP